MDFKEKLPSRKQITLVFASIVFPLYSWSTYLILDYLPSWKKSMKIWDILSINAYAYVWALIESVMLLLFLVVVAIILPQKWCNQHFASKGSILVWISYVFSYRVQINGYNIESPLGTGLALFACIIIGFILVSKSQKVNEIILSIADRLIVFLYIYIPISAISTIIVLYNNIRPAS